MTLYIRVRPRYINMIHTLDELKTFEESYFPGTSVLLGDLAMFNRPMIQKLLKLIEENAEIDCYSSEDLQDPVLLSRFMKVEKAAHELRVNPDVNVFLKSDKSFLSAAQYLDMSNGKRMLAVGGSRFVVSLLSSVK